MKDKIYYRAEHKDGFIILYSVVRTKFGGVAKNFVREFPLRRDAVAFAESQGWEQFRGEA